MPADELAQLQRLSKWKSHKKYDAPLLGDEAIELFNTQIRKRQAKFGSLSEAWDQIVPPQLCEHAYLSSFVRGTLVVLVDSSSHLFELKQLMLAGMEQQLLVACRASGLKKITLKRGSAPAE
jgi:hypothetical protein